MPRFQFRLKSLLSLREAERDARRGQLAEAFAAARQLQARRTELEAELGRERAALRAAVSRGSLDVDRLLAANRYELTIRAEIGVVVGHEELLAAEVERRRTALVAAEREVRVLEKLRERQLEQFRARQSAAETKLLDEVAARHFDQSGVDMGALIGTLGRLLAYMCVATCLAQGTSLAYLRANGYLTDDKLHKLRAVLEGVELAGAERESEPDRKEPDPEQPSYDDREQARDLRARNLELREQALNSRLELVRSEMRTLMTDKDRNEKLKSAFKEQLGSLRDSTLNSGMENVRLIWENINPKQSKELIMKMIENGEINEVVSILSAMEIDKRARIASQFKTPEDAVKLDEILRLIREGVPEVNLIDKTLGQLQP